EIPTDRRASPAIDDRQQALRRLLELDRVTLPALDARFSGQRWQGMKEQIDPLRQDGGGGELPRSLDAVRDHREIEAWIGAQLTDRAERFGRARDFDVIERSPPQRAKGVRGPE